MRLTPARLGVVAALLIAVGCAPGPPNRPDNPNAGLPRTITLMASGRPTTVALEDYVLGSALAEVSPVDEDDRTAERIFEVQAVLARTYAATHLGRHRVEGFDLCDQTHCQLYDPARVRTSRFTAIAARAVERTAGQVVLFQNRIAETLYHADCGGETADARDVWGGAVAYLKPIADEVPSVVHRRWERTLDSDALRRALDADDRTRLASAARLAVDVVVRDVSGRAASVAIDQGGTRRITGEVFRAIVNRAIAPPGLMSTRFEVVAVGDAFRFTGTGYGHGVGLCQAGAAARARRGDALADILAAYYPGTTLRAPR